MLQTRSQLMYWMTDQIAQYYIFTDFLESVKITPINYDADDLLTITKQTLGPQFMFKKKKRGLFNGGGDSSAFKISNQKCICLKY